MILTEEKNLKTVRKSIEDRIAKKYSNPFRVDGQKCFLFGESHYFMITGLPWEDPAIVVEHADTLTEAKKNFFEDGDLFYIDEMTEDEIVDAIIHEVESEG